MPRSWAFARQADGRSDGRYDARELLERGEPGGGLRDTVVPERAHPGRCRSPFDFLAVRVPGGKLLELVVHDEQLEDADPTLVAGAAAAGAANLSVENHPLARRGEIR